MYVYLVHGDFGTDWMIDPFQTGGVSDSSLSNSCENKGNPTSVTALGFTSFTKIGALKGFVRVIRYYVCYKNAVLRLLDLKEG